MKNLALGVLFAGLVAACGGGKKVNLIDAPPADAGVCNPLTQAGCAECANIRPRPHQHAKIAPKGLDRADAFFGGEEFVS